MNKILLGLTILPVTALAATVDLRWDPVEQAESYQLEMARAECTLTPWEAAGNTTDTTYTISDVPQDSLLLFRVGSVKGELKGIRTWSGAWYDYRLLPLDTPSGAGIE